MIPSATWLSRPRFPRLVVALGVASLVVSVGIPSRAAAQGGGSAPRVVVAPSEALGGNIDPDVLATIPEPLRPWIPWVLANHPKSSCARLDGQALCAWPGRLQLDLDEEGGRFEFDVVADRELEMALPGEARMWPREVTVGVRPARLLDRQGRPTVRLGVGKHRLAGVFRWHRAPESLAIPNELALVDLKLDGRVIDSPRRLDEGRLWLAATAETQPRQDRLEISVARRFDDGVPVVQTVHLDLRVSGRAREVDLGQPLGEGFVASWLDAGLPARIEDDGRLLVQLRPGRWVLRLTARSSGPVDAVGLAPRPEPWPEEEVWVFQADPEIRAVDPGGAPAVDPERTTLPDEWRGLPAFRLRPGQILTLQTLRRGAGPPPPDELTIERRWWLAFDGESFTVQDRLQGSANQGGRLAALAPATLGRFHLGPEDDGERDSAAGEGRDQVITRRADEPPGVEIRAQRLEATGEMVYPRGGALPAVGWNRDVSGLALTLHLPPGWTLLAAPGSDSARTAWIERWTLLDLFFLLIVSLASSRLAGRRQGLGTFVLLALAWHEPNATGLWVAWLALLAAEGLYRALASGKGRRRVAFLRLVTVGLFALQLFVFSSSQLKYGLFPQLETSARWGRATSRVVFQETMEEAVDSLAVGGARSQTSAKAKSLLYGSDDGRSAGIDPDAVPQTGPGIPDWEWANHRLEWNGPVTQDHRVRLWLLSPGLERLLSFLRVALALALAAGLLPWWRPQGEATKPETSQEDGEKGEPRVSDNVTALVLLFVCLASPVRAQAPEAEAPTPELLRQLEERLLAAAPCQPHCVEFPLLRLEASGETLRLRAEIHADDTTAWRLPGPAAVWAPTRVRLDGSATAALQRLDDGFLALRLVPGTHTVELDGPAIEGLDLQFPSPPRVLDWQGRGWRLDGLRPDQPPPGSVQLNRQGPEGDALDSVVASGAFTPWLELERTVVVGLPWAVEMELRRQGPSDRPVRLSIPLLAGEAVLDPGLESREGKVAVVLERGETVRRWRSELDEVTELVLQADDDPRWLERWTLDCSPVFHCRTTGLSPVSRIADGRWQPSWKPWPGESVTVEVDRPGTAEGATTTIDSARLEIDPGRRLLEGTLTLSLRSSRGGEQGLRLPAEAEVQRFSLDGVERPLEVLEGQVRFSVAPGHHTVELVWRQPNEQGPIERFPEVSLGHPAVNVDLGMSLAQNRWLLWAGGPSWGPVVAFWQVVLVIALAAWVLGRLAPTPLRTMDWFLLGLGMAQLPPAAVVVVLWLLALGLRERSPGRRWWSWSLQQVTLVALSLLALILLYAAVHMGLVVQPDMQVVGGESSRYHLAWTADASPAGPLPRPWVLWVPLFVWRCLMLLWALWLAHRLLRWLPWAWGRLTTGPLLVGPKGWKAHRLREE